MNVLHRRRLAAVCATVTMATIAVVGGGSPASAQEAPPDVAPDAVLVRQTEGDIGGGVADAVAAGPTRLFIGLDVAVDATAAIDAVQAEVLAALPPGSVVDVTTFETVPALAITTDDPAVVATLESLDQVTRVDVPVGGTGGLTQVTSIIGADVSRASGLTGAGYTVAVLDTGVDSDHPDLVSSVLTTPQACFGFRPGTTGFCPNGTTRQTGAGAAEDDAGHGTHVSGIISSDGVQSAPGVAPDAQILPVKVLDGCSFAGCFYDVTEIIAALDYINDNPGLGVDVINMSLGTNSLFTGDCDAATSWTVALDQVIDDLRAAGVITFASAGNNSNTNQMGAPACISGVISVGASTDVDGAASFSNSSSTTDLFAPGVNVVAPLRGGGTVNASGTSMASPAAAGCAVLLSQAGFGTSVAALEARLETSSVSVAVAASSRSFPRVACGLARPGIPTITSVTVAATDRLSVAVTPPASDGGAPLLNTRVVCSSSNGGTARSSSGLSSPLLVVGLTAGRTYSCRASSTNAVGTGQATPATAPIVLQSAPGAPTSVVATRSATDRFSVAFAAPTNDGGSPITSYRVVCSSGDGGVSRSSQGAASPITITLLTVGKTYTCRASATNATGSGPASTAGAPVVAGGVPGAPTAVTPVGSAPGRFSVSFAAPASDGGSPITSYRVVCTSSDGGVSRSSQGAASPITITALTVGRTYTCRASATNATGTSSTSTASAPLVAA